MVSWRTKVMQELVLLTVASWVQGLEFWVQDLGLWTLCRIVVQRVWVLYKMILHFIFNGCDVPVCLLISRPCPCEGTCADFAAAGLAASLAMKGPGVAGPNWPLLAIKFVWVSFLARHKKFSIIHLDTYSQLCPR